MIRGDLGNKGVIKEYTQQIYSDIYFSSWDLNLYGLGWIWEWGGGSGSRQINYSTTNKYEKKIHSDILPNLTIKVGYISKAQKTHRNLHLHNEDTPILLIYLSMEYTYSEQLSKFCF